MSTHPYIPLYVDDFDAHTAHLTPEEDGVYNRLLRLCWRTPGCSLPVDDAWIARKIRLSMDDFERIARPVIEEFFRVRHGRYSQKRLKAEYDDISRKKTARKVAGKKGGIAKALKDKENSSSNATVLLADMRASPEPYPYPEPERIEGGVVSASPLVPKPQTDDWPTGDLAKAIVEAVASPWLDPNKSPGLITTAGMITGWRQAGASWERDVIPVVTGLCAGRREPVATWKFFQPAILRSIGESLSTLEIPDAKTVVQFRGTGPPNIVDRITSDRAEAQRRAFERMDMDNGR